MGSSMSSAVPGATVVAGGDGRNILERATSEAEDMLTANPDINVIYADRLIHSSRVPWLQDRPRAVISRSSAGTRTPSDSSLHSGRPHRGFLMQKPALGGEMAVRLLVDYLNGEQIPARFTYTPDVVTQYNVEQFK